jgi:hypothetical protein
MKNDIPVFQNEYPLIKEKLLAKIKNPRVALIFYRDYGDAFLTKVYDFTDDFKQIDYLIPRINVDGGGDIPEAVYEAIAELKNLNFKSNNRIAFLVADAPPHPVPRGKITKQDAFDILKKLNIKINSICLPVK